jgi:transketolase
VIALSRQKIPFITETLTNKNMSNLGGYDLKKTNSDPEVTIIASGYEVQFAIDALNILQAAKINAKVVSMPCQ